ncbi:hypothetical protein DPEC_G00288350 [Dallia pectoralis]|uniref:Uncharacterized protein n=1 Tax=Dallia pectoralis TaxID=75939 RepID=A0ACC2FKI2_DALPE|nr:hypothetical protein DPEC_G00288350 [Dallia pectoralis]
MPVGGVKSEFDLWSKRRATYSDVAGDKRPSWDRLRDWLDRQVRSQTPLSSRRTGPAHLSQMAVRRAQARLLRRHPEEKVYLGESRRHDVTAVSGMLLEGGDYTIFPGFLTS